MNSNFKKFFLILIISLLSYVFAEVTTIPGVYRYRLDNGLELFVAENSAAPLAYIEIAVRAGAVTQTPENAGLFHLYEHLMFKGNAKYANQNEFTAAANRMGQIDQNGSTGVDRVNYYFTVPSSQVREGLEFWSYAIRTPLINEEELENEKGVVLSEINADFTSPAHIRTSAIFRALFPNSPWRLDPSGNPVNVQNATPEILRQIQSSYYIPQNSAIFVGGDVKADQVYSYVKEIYSDWKNPETEIPFEAPDTKTPLVHDKKLVAINPGLSDEMIQVGYYLRGPDGQTDASDTHFADVFLNIANNPEGVFVKTLLSAKELSIPEADYIFVSYPTARVSGILSFHAVMLFDEQKATEVRKGFGSFQMADRDNLNPADKGDAFLKVFKEKALPVISNNEEFFKPKGIDFVIQQLEDSRIYELESANAILSSLSYFWATCGAEYFFSYDSDMARVTEADVNSFIKNYIQDKKGVLVVSVSPKVWEKFRYSFQAHGYEEITAENAFWHKNYKVTDISK